MASHPLRTLAIAGTLVTGLFAAAPAHANTNAAAQARATQAIQPLPADLEQIRAAEAQQLYGSPDIRPMQDRKTGVITMGDSEISGEGAGNYEPGTHQDSPLNYCDRSKDQAVWRLTISADVRYNVACSGATPDNLRYGGSHQWTEINQGDNLAIKARNTHLKLLWVVVGANGDGTIQFGPVATDCAKRRILLQGPCWPTYTDTWATRVTGSRQQVAATLTNIKQTMADAGYTASDYQLAVMSYPSPGGPDVEDNPNFPGWYAGGCTLYLADAAFARNKAVPLFERGIRGAAADANVRYLDASRLFHGHGVCDDVPWARGVYIENGNIFDENAARQSLHPNASGHGAFAQCMSQFYASGWQQATCVDPASTNNAKLYNGLMSFNQLHSESGKCVDAHGYDSRNGTALAAWNCHGGRNQGFFYDSTNQTLNVELSQDRCIDANGGTIAAGTNEILYNCAASANQKWTFDGKLIHPKGHTDLCLGFTSTADNASLQLMACNAADTKQRWAFETRAFPSPVGYNHDDFIGSRVY
ncbi:ricin-type beta-trefoil lectin domain protein [Actinomadura barringtoniae]|uniref:Ricin-type beta-trefoil lectin domain protein n=1 Tax=Actinomadura barringtoniae TaxID=1427535 RepID=A0A939PJH4_9ACTN|nr:ricin-type beta-trefoil lectin domain protein [Actinomadura barringtoniae]MBO2451233.1 ricin-type beta-trefoil lectin domain protein [Actinomadura barringtoniae]